MPCNSVAVTYIEVACSLQDLRDNPHTIDAFAAVLPEWTAELVRSGNILFTNHQTRQELVFDGRSVRAADFSTYTIPSDVVDAVKTVSGLVAQQKAHAAFKNQGVVLTERWEGDNVNLTLLIDGIKSRAICEANGKVSVFIDEGVYGTVSKKLLDYVGGLKASGLSFTGGDRTEMHRHDGLMLTNDVRA